MELLKKLDWNIINEYLEKELLIMQTHPTKDLYILNYSKTCQYTKAWDLVTLSCRGLVVNGAGTIVARPFVKFFNKEEYEVYDDLPNIPENEDWEAFEKMDGSLGLLFYYDGWEFASRGSFASEQAIRGKEMFEYDVSFELDRDFTYIFEIIYPENRIVVNYGKEEKLVLLGVINTFTGNEMSYDEMGIRFYKYFFVVKRYEGVRDFNEMKALNLDNKEGFVVRFSSGFRMKVKFEEYCRLHSIVTNVSNKIVWETLKDGKSFEEMLDRVPDEFYAWVEKTKKELENAYDVVERQVMSEYIFVVDKYVLKNIFEGITKEEMKKLFAVGVMKIAEKNPSVNTGILFSMWDEKDYSQSIWKIVKPSFSKPFKDGVDES